MPATPLERPLVVARLRADGPDPGYAVYSEAYGLEMGFDPDWNVTLVVLAPHEHLRQVIENADVLSMGMQAGVTSPPPDLGTPPDGADWVMVEGPDARARLDAMLAAGRRCVVTPGIDLTGLTTEERVRVVVVAAGSSDGVDGLLVDGHFGDVLAICKTLGGSSPA